MSLIPSESLNFPDSFRANVGWRLADETGNQPADSLPGLGGTGPGPASGESTEPIAGLWGSPASVVSASAPTAEEEEQQLELIPKSKSEVAAAESSPGMAEMSALLRHFLASAPGSHTSGQQPNGEKTVPAQSPSPKPDASSTAGPTHARPPAAPSDIEPNESTAILLPVTSNVTTPPAVSPGNEAVGLKLPDTPSVSLPVVAVSPESAAEAEPVVPSGPMVIETPSQAHHILELIAAAVQRGALMGETIPEPDAPSTPPSAPVSPPSLPVSSPIPSPTAPPENPSLLPAGKTPEFSKAPAKIRITPRKIKPRTPEQLAMSQAAGSSHLAGEFSRELSEDAQPKPKAEHRPPMPIAAKRPVIPPSAEPVNEPLPRPDLSARKIATARMQFAQAELLRSTAKERRNRWIGFGLSELAVVTALILLSRFGFTHHFPDPTLKVLVFILIFAAAAVAVALPIAFFRNDPRRWGHES